jgi:acyl-CoA synthetase (AMP-forming)/AMP-acid ligase II
MAEGGRMNQLHPSSFILHTLAFSLDLSMLELSTLIARHAKYRPDATAVVFENARPTYREFSARVNRVANALRALGVGEGDKVATLLPNCL